MLDDRPEVQDEERDGKEWRDPREQVHERRILPPADTEQQRVAPQEPDE